MFSLVLMLVWVVGGLYTGGVHGCLVFAFVVLGVIVDVVWCCILCVVYLW